MKSLTVCRVSPANQREEHSCSQECVCQLKLFRKQRLNSFLNDKVNKVNCDRCCILYVQVNISNSCTFCLLQEVGLKPDTFYTMRLLEDEGVFASPGSDYDQKKGSNHIRYDSGSIHMYQKYTPEFHCIFLPAGFPSWLLNMSWRNY